jgi:predicted phage terminase large subunit-like protein
VPVAERMKALFTEGLTGTGLDREESTLKAEASLHEFTRQAFNVVRPEEKFVDGWHIGCMSAHLEALHSMDIKSLIINVPPRHMKSLLCTVFFPAWVWVRDAASTWLFGSYAASLLRRDAEYFMKLTSSSWYHERWGHRYRLQKQTAERVTNDRGGHRLAATVLGRSHGEGGQYLAWDDAIKPADAHHENRRDTVNRLWSESMGSRGNDPKKTRRLVVMQRLHERDLSGYLLAERTGYEHLVLPARYEPKRYLLSENPRDPIKPTKVQAQNPQWRDDASGSGRTDDGDPLWPSRFDSRALDELEAELEGSVSGQLQQRPAPRTGALFKEEHFRHFQTTPDLLHVILHPETMHQKLIPVSQFRCFQVVDTALENNPRAKYTAIGTFLFHRPTRNLLVWHFWRAKLEVHEQWDALAQLRAGAAQFDKHTRQWTFPGVLDPWPLPVLYQAVERKASGIGLLQQAALDGTPLVPLQPIHDKAVRAAVAVRQCSQGLVHFRAGAPWLRALLDELLSFPSGSFNDQCDCLAYASKLCAEDALLNVDVAPDTRVVYTQKLLRRPEEESREPPPPAPFHTRYHFGRHTVDLPED